MHKSNCYGASKEDADAQLNTKRALRESEDRIVAMETKMVELAATQQNILEKLQTLIDQKK